MARLINNTCVRCAKTFKMLACEPDDYCSVKCSNDAKWERLSATAMLKGVSIWKGKRIYLNGSNAYFDRNLGYWIAKNSSVPVNREVITEFIKR